MTVSTYKPGLTCSCPDYQNANVAANACLTCPNGCFLQWQSTPCHFHWLNVSDDLWWIDLLLLDHRRHDPGRHEHCLVFHRQTPRSFRYMSMQAPFGVQFEELDLCFSPPASGTPRPCAIRARSRQHPKLLLPSDPVRSRALISSS